MDYALLIIEPPGQRATRSRAEGEAVYAQMQAFARALAAEGRLKAVESLGGAGSARRIGPGGAATAVLDGPYAEAKEMVGGFFLLQGVTAGEALAIARRCPAAEWATVEIRPLAPCFDESEAAQM